MTAVEITDLHGQTRNGIENGQEEVVSLAAACFLTYFSELNSKVYRICQSSDIASLEKISKLLLLGKARSLIRVTFYSSGWGISNYTVEPMKMTEERAQLVVLPGLVSKVAKNQWNGFEIGISRP